MVSGRPLHDSQIQTEMPGKFFSGWIRLSEMNKIPSGEKFYFYTVRHNCGSNTGWRDGVQIVCSFGAYFEVEIFEADSRGNHAV